MDWESSKTMALAAILMANLLATYPTTTERKKDIKVKAALFHRLLLSWVYRDIRLLLCLLESSVWASIIIADMWYKTSKRICTSFCLVCGECEINRHDWWQGPRVRNCCLQCAVCVNACNCLLGIRMYCIIISDGDALLVSAVWVGRAKCFAVNISELGKNKKQRWRE